LINATATVNGSVLCEANCSVLEDELSNSRKQLDALRNELSNAEQFLLQKVKELEERHHMETENCAHEIAIEQHREQCDSYLKSCQDEVELLTAEQQSCPKDIHLHTTVNPHANDHPLQVMQRIAQQKRAQHTTPWHPKQQCDCTDQLHHNHHDHDHDHKYLYEVEIKGESSDKQQDSHSHSAAGDTEAEGYKRRIKQQEAELRRADQYVAEALLNITSLKNQLREQADIHVDHYIKHHPSDQHLDGRFTRIIQHVKHWTVHNPVMRSMLLLVLCLADIMLVQLVTSSDSRLYIGLTFVMWLILASVAWIPYIIPSVAVMMSEFGLAHLQPIVATLLTANTVLSVTTLIKPDIINSLKLSVQS
jgi:hypothetical protein